MPLRKKVSYRGLKDLTYTLLDTSPDSKNYFNVVEFPDRFTSGKNLFKLKANPENLVNRSVIDIEILDFNGNPIYYEPLKYVEKDGTRVIVVYIYPDTAPGNCTVYLAGRALRNPDTGETFNIDREANGTGELTDPNILWSRTCTVAPKARNNTEIIFTRQPKATITEVIQTYIKPPLQGANTFKTAGAGGRNITIVPMPRQTSVGSNTVLGNGYSNLSLTGPGTLNDSGIVTEGQFSSKSPNFGNQYYYDGPVNNELSSTAGSVTKSPTLTTFAGTSKAITNTSYFSSSMEGGYLRISSPTVILPPTNDTSYYLGYTLGVKPIVLTDPTWGTTPKTYNNLTSVFGNISILPAGKTVTAEDLTFAVIKVINSTTAIVAQIDGLSENSFGSLRIPVISNGKSTVSPTGSTAVIRNVEYITTIAPSSVFNVKYVQPTKNGGPTEASASFGDIILANIEPATGDVYKVKTLYKPAGQFGDFIDLGDTILEESELLIDENTYETDITVGVSYENYGYFENLQEINTYWTTGTVNNNTYYTSSGIDYVVGTGIGGTVFENDNTIPPFVSQSILQAFIDQSSAAGDTLPTARIYGYNSSNIIVDTYRLDSGGSVVTGDSDYSFYTPTPADASITYIRFILEPQYPRGYITYDSDVIMGGANLNIDYGSAVYTAQKDHATIFSISSSYHVNVYADTEYVVRCKVGLPANITSYSSLDPNIPNMRLDVYVSGSTIETNNEFMYANGSGIQTPADFESTVQGIFADGKELGYRIGTYQVPAIPENIADLTFRFVAKTDGLADLKFVVRNGSFIIGDVSLAANQESGFSPNTMRIFKRVPTEFLNAPLTFKFQFLDYQGRVADTDVIAYGVVFDGGNNYIAGTNNLLTGSVFIGNTVGSGIEMAGVNSAYIRSVGYIGFEEATTLLTGPPGLMYWSGSVLPDSANTYNGVGLELVADADNFFRYRTDPSELFVKTNAFFLGSDSQFISGANGNIEISSSNFHLTPEGNVTMSGAITAIGGFIGGFAISANALSGQNFYMSGSATGNQFFISSSNFNVKANGDVTGSNVLFTGGRISGSSMLIQTPVFYLGGSSQFISGANGNIEISSSNFHLDADGDVTMQGSITATAGTIGGFVITQNALTGSGFFISGSPGNASTGFFISSSKFNVKGNGDITGSNVLFTGGRVGGLTLTDRSLFVGTGTYKNDNTQLFISQSGHFSLKDRLSWDGTNLSISGSSVSINVPSFFLGSGTQYISGANGTVEILSDNFELAADGTVSMTGDVIAQTGTFQDVNVRGAIAYVTRSNDSDDQYYPGRDGTRTIHKTLEMWYSGSQASAPTNIFDISAVKGNTPLSSSYPNLSFSLPWIAPEFLWDVDLTTPTETLTNNIVTASYALATSSNADIEYNYSRDPLLYNQPAGTTPYTKGIAFNFSSSANFVDTSGSNWCGIRLTDVNIHPLPLGLNPLGFGIPSTFLQREHELILVVGFTPKDLPNPTGYAVRARVIIKQATNPARGVSQGGGVIFDPSTQAYTNKFDVYEHFGSLNESFTLRIPLNSRSTTFNQLINTNLGMLNARVDIEIQWQNYRQASVSNLDGDIPPITIHELKVLQLPTVDNLSIRSLQLGDGVRTPVVFDIQTLDRQPTIVSTADDDLEFKLARPALVSLRNPGYSEFGNDSITGTQTEKLAYHDFRVGRLYAKNVAEALNGAASKIVLWDDTNGLFYWTGSDAFGGGGGGGDITGITAGQGISTTPDPGSSGDITIDVDATEFTIADAPGATGYSILYGTPSIFDFKFKGIGSGSGKAINIDNQATDITFTLDTGSLHFTTAVSASAAAAGFGAGGSTFNSTSSVIGDNVTTSFTITHNFGTRNLHITVYESGSNFETVYPDIRRPTINTATIVFANPPTTTNPYIVYISQ